MSEDIISKAIDKIFAMKRSTVYLILIFILGFILRLIAAIDIKVWADDMNTAVAAINFFSSGKLVLYNQSSGLWFVFTDLMYKIFGMTQLGSRFAALLFGSFSILVIYLLSREFFNKRVSLIAAFLLAVSPFCIANTLAEIDVMAMFFVLLSMLLFIKALKTNKLSGFALSGVFIGLSIYTKVYPLLFMPSMLLYFVYCSKKSKEKILSKINLKKISVFLAIAFIFAIPALVHNYLLYQDKGFLDLQFTRTLGLGKNVSSQYYSWDYQFTAKNDWKGLILGTEYSKTPTLIVAINFFRFSNPLVFYFGIIGIISILLFRKENYNYLFFFLSGIVFILPFMASIMLLPKHYLFLELFLIPIAAFAINSANNNLTAKLKKDTTKPLIIALLIIFLIFLGLPPIQHFYDSNYPIYGKSAMSQMIEFKNANIPQNSLIIGDSRIYKGRINWAFQGRPFLEGSNFIQLLNTQDQIPGSTIQADVYYFECVIDDCGWGGDQVKGEFNDSMESLTDFFKQNGKLLKTISEPSREKPYFPLISEKNKIENIKVYSAKMQIKDSIVDFANQPKEGVLNSIGYLPIEKQFDYYETSGFLDKLLDKLAHLIRFISLLLAFLSLLYPIYLLKNKNKISETPSTISNQSPQLSNTNL